MARKYVIKLEPMNLNIAPLGFHKYARDYLRTADNLILEPKYSPVPYFLYCRAIELGLKAFLLAKGKKLKFVKDNVGHDLTKGLENARQFALDDIIGTTEIEKKQIELANKYYKEKGFEYFFVLNHASGLQRLPELDVLKKYTHKLLNKIKPLTDNTDVFRVED
jgi:hypothetical protein